MDDRELLELAAKAAAIGGGWGDKIEYHNGAVDLRDVWILEGDGFVPWNPLTDDGDALRLAVTLSLRVECYTGIKIHPKYSESHVTDVYSISHPEILLSESHNGDPFAATRRAIVRAAAEIGRAM